MKQRGSDPLANRLIELRRLRVVAIGQLLDLLEEMHEDAIRQYDTTATNVIEMARDRLVRALEAGSKLDRLISVQEAADIVRRPAGTIRHWCRKGKVKARKVAGGEWEIDRESLYAPA